MTRRKFVFSKRNRTSLWKMLLGYQLDENRYYNEEVESFIEKGIKRFSEMVDGWAKEDVDEDIREEIYEIHSDEYFRLSEMVPNKFRSTLFVNHFTLIEDNLKRIVRAFELNDRLILQIKISDLKKFGNQGIDLYKQVIKKIQFEKQSQIQFPDKTREWQEITNFRKLRNLIVHNNGEFDDENKQHREMMDYVRGNPKFLELKNNELVIKKDFSPYVLKTIESFFDKLFDVLKPIVAQWNKDDST